jgi:hypothetical protein
MSSFSLELPDCPEEVASIRYSVFNGMRSFTKGENIQAR